MSRSTTRPLTPPDFEPFQEPLPTQPGARLGHGAKRNPKPGIHPGLVVATRNPGKGKNLGASGADTAPKLHPGIPLTRVLCFGALGVLVAVLLNLLCGYHPIAVVDLIAALRGEMIPGVSFILWEDRLPQAAVGILAGAAFGASGAIFQRMLRNPLASPDVIGVGYGASAAAVAGMLLFGAQGIALSLLACLGALIVALLIYKIADAGKHTGPRLILAGIAMAAMLQGIIQYLLTRTDVRSAADALRWLTGSLSASTWERAGLLGAALAILFPLLLPAASRLRILELGDDTAAGLGLNPKSTRLGLILLGVGLTAVATAVTGPLAFVSFLAGPLALRLCKGRSHLGAAAITGALLVTLATFIAGNVLPDIQLPVGVVTGALGAPFLIWVLVRSNKEGS